MGTTLPGLRIGSINAQGYPAHERLVGDMKVIDRVIGKWQ